MASFALLGVHESRNAFEKKPERLDISSIRFEIYKLMAGNWDSTLVDLGDVEEGEKVEDTYFVVNQIVAGPSGGKHHTHNNRRYSRHHFSNLQSI